MRSRQLLPAFDLHRKLPVNYDTMFAGKELFVKAEEHFPAVSLHTVTNAYVSPYGVVFRNGRICRGSVYGMFSAGKQWPSFIKKIALGRTDRYDEPLWVAHHAYYENYYHWLCEIMPRIFLGWKTLSQSGPALLMHRQQPRFVREYLSLFQGMRIVELAEDRLAHASELHYSDHIARPLAYHEGLMREMAAWLREELAGQGATASPEKIFISRKQARYRITRNEAEIESYLLGLGFQSITPEQFSILEQANLFKNARIIIGSHGAGFANLLFAPRCELAVDIIHREHPQDCFYNLASALGSAYFYFQCEGTGRLDFKNNDDIVVDIERFKAQVGHLLI